MQGVRHDCEPHLLQPGEYGKWKETGHWYCVPPGTGLLAGLGKHTVEEHSDGTISVMPSILVGGHDFSGLYRSWHGYLTRGVFKEC